jgi:hypothetical protein
MVERSPEDEARHWKEQAEKLLASNRELQKLVLKMIETLPFEAVRKVWESPEGSTAAARSVLEGWKETAELSRSDAATELKLLWERAPDRESD